VSQNLLHASSHLELLLLCDYDNGKTKQLYTKLQTVFNEIREIAASTAYHHMREPRLFVKEPLLAPSKHCDSIAGAADMNKTIVDVTRKIRDVVREALELKNLQG